MSALHRARQKILDRKTQIVGDKAVVTQKARFTQAETTATVSRIPVYGATSEY